MYALCAPFTGWISDRFSRLADPPAAYLFGRPFGRRHYTYQSMVWCRALGGLGRAFTSRPRRDQRLPRPFHVRARCRPKTAVYAGNIAGGSISALVGQYSDGARSFIFFGSCGIALGIVLMFLLREPRRGQSELAADRQPLKTSTAQALREILGNRMVLLLIGIFMGANFVAVVFLTWLPTFLYNKFHMSLSMAGLNASLYLQAASFLGVLCGGYLADRFSRRHGGGWSNLLSHRPSARRSVSLPHRVDAFQSRACLCDDGFGYFKGPLRANIIAGLYDIVAIRNRGTAAGIANSLGWLGGGLAPVIIAIGSAKVMHERLHPAPPLLSYLIIGLLRCSPHVDSAVGGPANASAPLLPAADISQI